MPSQLARRLSLAPVTALAALLAGCGAGNFDHVAPVSDPVSFPAGGAGSIQGTAHGGQQPVAGATLQLYAANLASYGGPATPLITSTVTTDNSGAFNITGDYTCPTPDAPVYLVATGGNPGLSSNNPNLAEMAALGSCATLKANAATTFIQMNELTTVGAVYALAPFMSGLSRVGALQTNTAGLNLAFADVNVLVNNSTGTVGGPALPTGATLSTAEVDTLADILGACINSSGGTAGDTTTCGKLFTAATPTGGTAPTDTITAAMNIIQHPGQNVPALFLLTPGTPPFQPTLSSAPNDWTLAITYTAGALLSPSAVAVDAGGNIWITNRSGNTATELAHSGAVLLAGTGSLSGPSGIALDATGSPWISNASNNTLTHLTANGTFSATASNGGLSAPAGIAIDPQGNVWVANSEASVVSNFSSTGTALSTTGYTAAGIVKPLGIAISAH